MFNNYTLFSDSKIILDYQWSLFRLVRRAWREGKPRKKKKIAARNLCIPLGAAHTYLADRREYPPPGHKHEVTAIFIYRKDPSIKSERRATNGH